MKITKAFLVAFATVFATAVNAQASNHGNCIARDKATHLLTGYLQKLTDQGMSLNDASAAMKKLSNTAFQRKEGTSEVCVDFNQVVQTMRGAFKAETVFKISAIDRAAPAAAGRWPYDWPNECKIADELMNSTCFYYEPTHFYGVCDCHWFAYMFEEYYVPCHIFWWESGYCVEELWID